MAKGQKQETFMKAGKHYWVITVNIFEVSFTYFFTLQVIYKSTSVKQLISIDLKNNLEKKKKQNRKAKLRIFFYV